RTRDADLTAFHHQDLPFETLVDALNPARTLSHHPLFQVALTYNNLPPTQFVATGLTAETIPIPLTTAKFDLGLHVAENEALFEYSTDLFDPGTIPRLADRLLRVLDQITADPTRRLSDISVLIEGENAVPARRTHSGAKPAAQISPADASAELTEGAADNAEILASIFAELVGSTQPITVTTDFFEAGGDSIS